MTMKLKDSRALLGHPAYAQRVRLPKYNGAVLARNASTARDGANILIRLHPAWTRADHKRLAEQHAEAATLRAKMWGREADKAALETLGRKFVFTDYQISGVGCEAFSEARKTVLRDHAHSRTQHSLLASIHAAAAKSRRIA